MLGRAIALFMRVASPVLLAALPVAMAAPAQAQFGPPFPLSQASQDAFGPQVAMDADGDALVTWRRFDGTDLRIQARARSKAGVLGPILTLSQANAFDPQVAMDSDGDALITWYRTDGTSDRVQARARSKAGVLGPILTLSGQDALFPQVAMDADGDALVAWRRSDGMSLRIQARARSAAGVLGPILTLSQAGLDASGSQVAMDADGDALVVWFRYDGTSNRIQARARSEAGVLGPILTLSQASQAGQDARAPQVAMDADGDALVTWYRFDGTNTRIQARARSKAGVLGPILTLSQAGQHAVDPQVAMAADGDALVTWRRNDGTHYRIQARARSKTGVLGPILTLSQAGQDASGPQAAMDADGDALVTWSNGTSGPIQARGRSKAGVVGPIVTLSQDGQLSIVPQVAMAADGDVLVTWLRSIGSSPFRVVGAVTP